MQGLQEEDPDVGTHTHTRTKKQNNFFSTLGRGVTQKDWPYFMFTQQKNQIFDELKHGVEPCYNML
jgi:hypothetical protein